MSSILTPLGIDDNYIKRRLQEADMIVSAKTIAYHVIGFFQEMEDWITNLKLQKLLYYIQGWHLGLNGTPLFDEDFQAWVHGPVQPAIYEEYKHNQWNPILEKAPDVDLPVKVICHIEDVLKVFGVKSAYELEKMTRNEPPWLLARGLLSHDEDCTNIITKESMRTYFSDEIEYGKERPGTSKDLLDGILSRPDYWNCYQKIYRGIS